MAATATRTKRAKPQRAVYRLTTGSWGASENAPDFGPVRPPDASRTERVVKDILRVGKWDLGNEVWTVTPKTLAQIAADFAKLKTAGNEPNLGKTHGDPETLLIHPDDLMAPLDDLKVVGDTLWASAYVTPEQKSYLANPARKVSVGVVPDYVDGAGNRYSMALVHVAVTDRPVVTHQGPFLAAADGGGASMNPDLLDAINVLMEAAGLGKLGDVADETALIEQLKGVAAALGKEPSGGGEPAPEGGGEPMLPDIPMPDVPPAMAKSIKGAIAMALNTRDDKIKTLEKQLSDRDAADKAKAEQDFMVAADRLVKSGATVADVNRAKLLAKQYGYDQRFLEGIPTPLGKGGAARTLASTLPNDGSKSEEDRKADIAKDIAKRRGISVEAARKFVP